EFLGHVLFVLQPRSFSNFFFFFSSRRRHTRYWRDWSSDVCSSDLLGADVVGVVIARAEGVGAEHDAALDLGPKTLATGALVGLSKRLAWYREPVLHAIEARQIRARLRRCGDVVGRQGVFSVRQAYLDQLGAERFELLDRL